MIDADDLLIKVLRRKRLHEGHKTIRLRRRRQRKGKYLGKRTMQSTEQESNKSSSS